MSHDDMDDAFLERALFQAMEYRLGMIPEGAGMDHAFSRRHRRRVRALLRQAARPQKVNRVIFLGRRAAAVLVAALVAAFGAVMGVEAWREALFRFIQQKFPQYSIVSYEQIGETVLPDELIRYAPDEIPEGYTLVFQRVSTASFNLIYEDAEGEALTFLQMRLDAADVLIDTEFSDFEEVVLGDGTTARYLPNEGVHSIMWENNAYAFLITSTSDKVDIKKLAENTKLQK